MNNKAGEDLLRPPPARDQILSSREQLVERREQALDARERLLNENEAILIEREMVAGMQGGAARSRTEVDQARIERERLLAQMLAANEQLLLTTLRADELSDAAELARAESVESARRAIEGQQRAEALASQLEGAEVEARASVRAKDEFLAMLGHELRNPLAPIQTALDLMTMRDPHQFERERSIIERQVHHLVRLVDDLLDVSRLTGGKIELQREVVELADVVALAVETAAPLLEAKAHQLTISVGPGLLIDADISRLTQVISNLVVNAAKYTKPQGAIAILGERRGQRVWLAVRDNGIGISAEMLPHVFELFAQEAQGSDRPAGGLGLGLAIVKSLLSMHGGTVSAQSPGLGHGSQFEIELPECVPPCIPTRQQRPSTTMRTPTIVPRKVLVVDDNRDAAELIAMSLTKRGHDTRIAVDAPSALVVVKDFIPDIVLLDINLPVVDGYELADLLRASVAPQVVQFVAITGYGQPEDRQRSQDAGFALHLVKPVSIARLEQGIREVARDLPQPS